MRFSRLALICEYLGMKSEYEGAHNYVLSTQTYMKHSKFDPSGML